MKLRVPFFFYKLPSQVNNEKIKNLALTFCNTVGVKFLGVYRKDETETKKYTTLFRKRVVEYTQNNGANYDIEVEVDDAEKDEKIKNLKLLVTGWLLGIKNSRYNGFI